MIKNYIIISIRNLIRHKTFSFINIFGFSFSLAICLLVIQILFSVGNSDRFHDDKDLIYRLISHPTVDGIEREPYATCPLPIAEVLREDVPGVETITRMKRNFNGDAEHGEKIIPVRGHFADNSFFNLFNFNLIEGDFNTPLAEPYTVVLTQKLANKFFGNSNPIGKTIKMGHLGEYRVTAIMEDIDNLPSHFRFELLGSMASIKSLEEQKVLYHSLDHWTNTNDNYIYFKISDNASAKEMNVTLNNELKKHYSEVDNIKISAEFQKLTKISPGEGLSNEIGNVFPSIMVYTFLTIAFVVLAITIFNFSNLSIAKSLKRSKEVGIRKVAGAKRKQLVFQFTFEAIIVSLISLNFAYLFLTLLQQGFYSLHREARDLLNTDISITIVIAFLLFAILAGVIAGFFPALYQSKFSPIVVLKDIMERKSKNKFSIKTVLITLQLLLSGIFIFTAITMYKQMKLLSNLDTGFVSENVINLNIAQYYKTSNIENIGTVSDSKINILKNELLKIKGVKDVSFSAFVLGTGNSWRSDIVHPKSNDTLHFDYISVSANFIDNLGMRLIAGKNFKPGLWKENEAYFIINKKAVKWLGYASPEEALGEKIIFNSTEREIIGVVDDFIHQNFESEIRPLGLTSELDEVSEANIKLDNNNTAYVLDEMKKVWEKLDPIHKFDAEVYSVQLENANGTVKIIFRISSFIAFFIITISMLGLLGMVVFATEGKIKEIGVRKALGASNTQIVHTISREYLILIVLAFVLGTPVSFKLNKFFLQESVNQIPISLDIFAITFFILFGLTAITVLSQTLKAAMANPSKSIRYE